MSRLELNTKSVWGPTWYQRGQKHPSTCPEGDEHPSSSAAPWLELTAYLHISCEIRNVWILFEKPWFRCVFCFIVFHCVSCGHFGNFMLFQTGYVSRASFFRCWKRVWREVPARRPMRKSCCKVGFPLFRLFCAFLCMFGEALYAGASVLSDDSIVQDVCNDSVEIQCLSTKECRVKSRSRCQVQQRRWTLFALFALFFTLFFTLSHVYKCEIERF